MKVAIKRPVEILVKNFDDLVEALRSGKMAAISPSTDHPHPINPTLYVGRVVEVRRLVESRFTYAIVLDDGVEVEVWM